MINETKLVLNSLKLAYQLQQLICPTYSLPTCMVPFSFPSHKALPKNMILILVNNIKHYMVNIVQTIVSELTMQALVQKQQATAYTIHMLPKPCNIEGTSMRLDQFKFFIHPSHNKT